MKNVKILFPPCFRDFTKPNLITGRIQGFLREKQLEASQMDLNIAWIRFLLSAPGVRQVKAECQAKYNLLREQASLNPVEQKILLTITWAAVIPEDLLVAEAGRVLTVFKGSDFFKLRKLHKANQFLLRLLETVNTLLLDGTQGRTFNPFVSYNEIMRIVVEDTLHHQFHRAQVAQHLPDTDYVVIALASNAQLLDSCILAREIKEAYPKTTVIFCGHPFTILKDTLMARQEVFQFVDYIIYGEMEIPLLQLLEEREPAEITNLIYCAHSGEVKVTPQTNWSITQWGHIDFTGVNLDEYLSPLRVLPMYASKGCVWAKCKFCNIFKSSLEYEERSLEQIVANLKELQAEHQVTTFYFPDEALAPQMLQKLSERILAEKLQLYWTAQTRFSDLLTAEVFQDLVDSGCIHLEFGLESADEEVLLQMNKGITLETVQKNLREAAASGLINTVNIMTGYPGDLEPQKTLDFLLENRQYIDRVSNFAFFVTRGSMLDEHGLEYGVHVQRDEYNDLQCAYQEYALEAGLSWKAKEEMVNTITKTLNSYQDAFISNPYPILEYCVYYQTRDVKVIEKLSEGSRQETLQFYQKSEEQVLCRKAGLAIIDLEFDLLAIKKSFQYKFAGNLLLAGLPPLPKSPGIFVVDSLEDNIYQVPGRLRWLLEHADGQKTLDELAFEFTQQGELTFEQSKATLGMYLTVYRFLFC